MAARVGRGHHLQALLLAALLPWVREAFADLKVHANGLIYDSTTMAALQAIAVDQTVSFKTCPSQKSYLSLPQATGNYIRFKEGSRQIAKKLEGNPSYEEVLRLFGNSIEARKEGSLVVLRDFIKYDGVRTAKYQYFDEKEKLEDGFEAPWSEPVHGNRKVSGTWLVRYYSYVAYGEAIWFESDFRQTPLPIEASIMVSYADCMIDTTTSLRLPANGSLFIKRTGRFEQGNDIAFIREPELLLRFPAIRKFKKFTRLEMPPYRSPEYLMGRKPASEEEEWRIISEGMDTLRARKQDSISRLPGFHEMLEKAVEEAMETGLGGEDLEGYCKRHLSKRRALDMKRTRRVMGSCSQDDRPRYHAQEIAALAAESKSWDVFLRAHLDIMNDRFDRVSDGSYAWEGRKTYIRELEGLGLDVRDLLFGIAFAYHQPADNHYQGRADRLGRAMAESGELEELLATAFDFVTDPALDEYNKVLLVHLWANIVRNIESPLRRDLAGATLRQSLDDLRPPLAASLRARIKSL